MRRTIVLIGAGSAMFGLGTVGDLFMSKTLEGSHIVLHDINPKTLQKVAAVAKRVIQEKNLPYSVSATTSRQEALRRADFCVISIEVGDRYGLWDPSSVTWEGYYNNEELLALYRRLVRQGKRSYAEAFKVGATIQEVSILDLREYRAETDDEDVQLVYENLLRASRNHLRVFAALLQEQGEAVERQYLTQSLFDEIVGTPPEPGMELEEDAE